DAMALIADGKKAFAVLRTSVESIDMHQGPDIGWAGSAPKLEYLGFVEISEKEVNEEESKQNDYFLAPGAMSLKTIYKTSAELQFGAEEVALYRAFQQELRWYEEQAEQAGDWETTKRLNADRDALAKKLDAAFGP